MPSFHSLWRRLAAVFTDVGLLWLLGMVLCLMFFEPLVALGKWGILIGATVAMAYTTALDAGGGTLGKRLFGLRIVDAQGRAPGWRRALVRNLVRVLPWFILDFLGQTNLTAVMIGGVVLQPLYVASTMLVVFDRSHRAVHDLLAHTSVHRVAEAEIPPPTALTRRSLLLVLVPCVIGWAGVVWTQVSPQFSGLERICDAVNALPNLTGVSVNDMTAFLPGETVRTLNVAANYSGDLNAPTGPFVLRMLDKIEASGVDLSGFKRMHIGLRRMAMAGIAWRSNDVGWDRPMTQWRYGDFTDWEQLAGEAPTHWNEGDKSLEVRTWFYRTQDANHKPELAYVVQWNDPDFDPAKMNASFAKAEAAPVLAYLCAHETWRRFSLPDGKTPIFANTVGVLLAKWPKLPRTQFQRFGVMWKLPADCPGK